ncbi:MAG: hypothetical protein Q8P82_02470, partial [bacterium]|nr:hypothetical protein [bacterium]
MSQAKSVNHPSLVFIKKRTVAVFAIFVILTPFFLSAVHGTHAATSDDLSGRTLTEGRWIVPSASSEAPMMDKFLQDKVNKFMYEKAELKIERDGKVTGGIDSTFDDIEWLNSGLLYAGEVKLMLNGDYDAKENTMSGRFEIKQSAYHSDTNSSVKWDAAGSFKGSRAVDGSFVLTFSGEENWMSEPYSDGGSRSLSYDVVFSDAASTPSASDEGSCYIAFSEARPASFFPFIPTAQAIDSGARFTDFSGEVTVSYGRNYRELEDNLRLAEQDMVLGVGAHINTESDSSAIISFADMTTFCMKE